MIISRKVNTMEKFAYFNCKVIDHAIIFLLLHLSFCLINRDTWLLQNFLLVICVLSSFFVFILIDEYEVEGRNLLLGNTECLRFDSMLKTWHGLFPNYGIFPEPSQQNISKSLHSLHL